MTTDAPPRLLTAAELENIVPVEGTRADVAIDYRIYAGYQMSRFLEGLQRGELIAARSRASGLVYAPPVGVCPVSLERTTEPFELKDTATLITYIVVHIPVRDKAIDVPYACGDVLLDGCDTPLLGLIQGVAVEDVRRGMRLRAVLLPEGERPLDSSAISHFEPIDEPDVDVDELVRERRDHVASVHERLRTTAPGDVQYRRNEGGTQ